MRRDTTPRTLEHTILNNTSQKLAGKISRVYAGNCAREWKCVRQRSAVLLTPSVPTDQQTSLTPFQGGTTLLGFPPYVTTNFNHPRQPTFFPTNQTSQSLDQDHTQRNLTLHFFPRNTPLHMITYKEHTSHPSWKETKTNTLLFLTFNQYVSPPLCLSFSFSSQ